MSIQKKNSLEPTEFDLLLQTVCDRIRNSFYKKLTFRHF